MYQTVLFAAFEHLNWLNSSQKVLSETATGATWTKINPLIPTVAIWVVGTAIKHHVPDQVKPSFVSFDIRAL